MFLKEALPLFVVALAQQVAELLQGFLLLLVQIFRGLDIDGDVLVAPAPAVQRGDALAPQAEHAAGLGALGDVVLHLAVDGGDLQRAAQHRLGVGDGGLAEYGGTLPAEDLVGLHHHGDQQVAAGAAVLTGVALSPQGDGLAVVDTGGDVDLDGPALADAALAVTVGAGLVDDPAGAAALGAGGGGGEHAHGRLPPGLDAAAAVAGGAHLRGSARGTAVALTGGALLAALHGELLLAAEGRLGKGDGDGGADALAPLGRVGVAPLLTAEAAAEKAAENVAQIAEVEACRAVAPSGTAGTCAIAGIHAREAELVVPGLLIGIGQHLVGLVDLLELLLGLLVAGVHVRVVLPRQLFICLFDLVLRRALADAENLIIITFVFCHRTSLHSKG